MLFLSVINSDLEKRKEQSLGNINEHSIYELILNGGIKIECEERDFLNIMTLRILDFGAHKGDHLEFKDGRMCFIGNKRSDFLDRAYKALEKRNFDEFLVSDNSNNSTKIEQEYPDER